MADGDAPAARPAAQSRGSAGESAGRL